MSALQRVDPAGAGWVAALGVAAAFPLLVQNPFYFSIGITALIFVGLAVAFDLVVGRIGALSLTQPLFFGFGAYVAALLSVHADTNFWVEAGVGAVGAVVLAVLVGIPSFRLSLHSFAIGTLGFAAIGQVVAENWVQVTRGPYCVTGVAPLRLPFPGGTFMAVTLSQQYYVILAVAALIVAAVFVLTRVRLDLAFTAVRDDPVLASARGLSPNGFRIGAFGASAAFSAVCGAFAAHFQAVVCATSLGFAYTTALLIMVFVGGRASLRGVVAAAVIFTAVPQLLRVTDEWRLTIYGLMLLVVVLVFPDGLERLIGKVRR
ncbi:MAG: hypothetical protein GEU74_16785 [Nitriliruptorales bacterium]|nr:hypothetical protein [Nitriliruptorales bacterium]